MAKRGRTSKARTTFIATVVLFAICGLPFLLPGCRLDTSPLIERHPPVESDDSDSGETK